ncbi:MAG: hypothetical protein JWQ29_1040 [Phenylobacterium sp.]|nr:hypothetical protein [Phenylobacterium sp.]
MDKLSIADRAPDGASAPKELNLAFTGEIVSRRIISRDSFTLSLWRHELAPGATIRIERPKEDHVFYVLEGEFRVGGSPIGAGGAASVAKDAIAEVSGGAGGATVLHYVGDAETRPDKAGGCVHIMSQGWTEHSPVSSHTLYLDSSCPTCSVWLHRTRGDGGRFTAPHHHTEDEIICVVQGELELGTRRIVTGGAAGVGKHLVYSFTAGEDGLTFVNFRQADPYFVPKDGLKKPPASERVLVRALLDRLSAERLGAAV